MKTRIVSLALALVLCLSLTVPALAKEKTSNIGNGSDTRNITSFLYTNEKGGLTRVELTYTDLIVEEYNSSFQMVSHRYLTGAGTGFCGFYPGQDYNFVIHATVKPEGDAAISVEKYSKDWQRLQTATLWDANTTGVGTGFDCVEKNGMLFIHGEHTMLKSADGKQHQANFSMTVRVSDMTVVDSFHQVGGPAYVSHSLGGWHVLADQEDNLAMFEVGDGYPRAPVFHRLKGYAASAVRPKDQNRITLFDIPGVTGDNYTGVHASGLEETQNYYVLAYRANSGLPAALVQNDSRVCCLAFIRKSDLNVNTVRLESPAKTSVPRLIPSGLNGGYVIWRDAGDYEGGDVYLASYSDGSVSAAQKLGKAPMSDCSPILYNGRLVWYVTRYSEPVFYGADTTGIHTLNASTTAPGTLGGSSVTPPQPAQGATAGGFTDVAADSPYKDAIAWAVEQGITNGTGSATFSPSNTCTVRQILTFLYRANGRPYASSSLSDLDAAEAWAISQGISKDDASAPCTRAAAVTYLWKAAGSPAPTKTAAFSDVPASADYAKAVSWAVEKGITNGVGGGTFSPGGTCTRGQIVTFLYRANQASK